MKVSQLIRNSLLHYWPVSLAMILGVIIGTASITGALIVGDSVRGSLRKMTFDRLGKIDFAITGYRFYRENLLTPREGEAFPESKISETIQKGAPAISLLGGFEFSKEAEDQEKETLRASNVSIYGIDERFWNLVEHETVEVPEENQVVLNSEVAKELNIKVGDSVSLWIELPATIPRDTLLGDKDELSREIILTVSAILEEKSGLGRFDLNPSQQLPSVAFVSLAYLQSQLGLDEQRDRRTRKTTPARVNSFFFPLVPCDAEDQENAKKISEMLVTHSLELEDLQLRIISQKEKGYFSLESERQILENAFSDRAISIAENEKLDYSPVLVYLINEFSKRDSENPDAYSMYSTIAGVVPQKSAPFGPFLDTEGNPVLKIGEEEILINSWLAKDLEAKAGDEIRLKYHEVGSDGTEPEIIHDLKLKSVLKLDDTVADDRGFVPEVKGITDAETFGEWDQPFPMDFDRITERDDIYWSQYKATPKAFISLELAQKWWKSRYGELTSIRIAPREGKTPEEEITHFRNAFLKDIPVEETGLIVIPVKNFGLQAASGTTDFSGLFIGFSFFLILSATILISLLFRLGLDQRTKSVGLLSALGFNRKQIKQLFYYESFVILGIGTVIGAIVAVYYAELILYGLKTWWYGAIGTRFLEVYITPESLINGMITTILITIFAIWRSLGSLKNFSTRSLLLGNPLQEEQETKFSKRTWVMMVICLGLIIMLLTGSLMGLIPASEAFSGISWQVVAFFLTGISLLVLSLSFFSYWLKHHPGLESSTNYHTSTLAFRNASRNCSRSIYTVALVASATFVIVAVAAGHRNPQSETPELHSGNGGFTLVAESSVPILQELNDPEDLEKLNLEKLSQLKKDKVAELEIFSFGMKPGENASCLNIYQTRLPTILGVPNALIERGGFKFADTPSDHPWQLLLEENKDGSIPVLGDMNTLMYSLHKGIGATIQISEEDPESATLKIEGMFDGSVFQGVLLMSMDNLRKLFPEEAGFQYFLIQTKPDSADEVSTLLETGLTEYGFDVERVSDQLAAFLSVQNTYLSTFQTIGGFGLFLGTFGLAIVMMRNVLERQKELALMRSVGFQSRQLAWLILLENGLLLVWGLVSGTVSALLAMLPHLLSTGADLPWLSLFGSLLLILIVGMISAFLAVYQTINSPVIPSLRAE